MPSQSPFQIPIPSTDLLTYLFSPSTPSNPQPSFNEPLYIDANNTSHFLTPHQTLQWIKRLGLGLQSRLGLQRQDVVMLYTQNHIFVPVAYLGIAGSGCVFSGCNSAYGVDETAYQMQNTGCKVVFVEPGLLGTVLGAAEKVNFPKEKVFLFSDSLDEEIDEKEGVRDWKSFLPSEKEAEEWKWHEMTAEESRTSVAALNYSSGTTGLPKGVMISHQNVMANVEQSIFMRDLEQPYMPTITPTTTTTTTKKTSTPRPPERWLTFLPLYHAYGQLWSIVAALRTRTPCFYMRSFTSYPTFLAHIQQHRITHIQTAPPILVMLAKRPETSHYDISSLRNILCGAAPLSKELQNEVVAKCDVDVVQTWGMTEVTCSCLHVPGGRDDRSGSVGFIDPNAEIKLIDDEGREVGVGERGEIYVRGPNVCMGYWRNENATKETFDEEGYLKTGDVAVRNEEGWYWIVDRKKELIKVKGFQVAPAELEAVLLEHEGVGDAAVCALQLEHEELPRAYVAIKPEYKGKCSEWDIEQWMAGRVAKHKQLSGGVVFIDEVPKSSSGKIQRKILRDWAKRDAEGWSKRREGAKL